MPVRVRPSPFTVFDDGETILIPEEALTEDSFALVVEYAYSRAKEAHEERQA